MRRRGGRSGPEREIARADARALRKTHTAYAPGWAVLLEAAVARCDGELELATEQLRAAIAILDEHQIALYAAAARRRLGQLLGGDTGAAARARRRECTSKASRTWKR